MHYAIAQVVQLIGGEGFDVEIIRRLDVFGFDPLDEGVGYLQKEAGGDDRYGKASGGPGMQGSDVDGRTIEFALRRETRS